MQDILEFEVCCQKNGFYFSDEIADKFIFFIEEKSVFFGGGYSPDKINGGLYADEETVINIDLFIKDLIDFFLNLNTEINIKINIEAKYFDKFNFDNVRIYSQLLKIEKWDVDL
jgi:hypothetical protein